MAARIALADVLVKSNDRDGALEELRQVTKQDSQDPAVFERIGDLEAARQHTAEASTAYQSALDLNPERGMRKRIEKKLRAPLIAEGRAPSNARPSPGHMFLIAEGAASLL